MQNIHHLVLEINNKAGHDCINLVVDVYMYADNSFFIFAKILCYLFINEFDQFYRPILNAKIWF